jgi:hypothetical protein
MGLDVETITFDSIVGLFYVKDKLRIWAKMCPNPIVKFKHQVLIQKL